MQNGSSRRRSIQKRSTRRPPLLVLCVPWELTCNKIAMYDSSTLPPENATENVRTGRLLCRASCDEQDGSYHRTKTHNGTSLIICAAPLLKACSAQIVRGGHVASAFGGDQ